MNIVECTQCRKKFVPPQYTCPACGNNRFRKKRISSKGRIYSFTIVHVAPEAFANQAPYVPVVVELSDKLRVTARLLESNRKPEIGLPVVLKCQDAIAYWFELV